MSFAVVENMLLVFQASIAGVPSQGRYAWAHPRHGCFHQLLQHRMWVDRDGARLSLMSQRVWGL
ncbi:MAG TPA: hypothetical protein VI542_17595 [Candidatus Tectomicrobia bacterium]